MLNTTPYGGGLWHTWFDRDLGIAGRAIIRTPGGALRSELFRIDQPIARIPNLAIHLTSGSERESFTPNLQEHAKAILTLDSTVTAALPAADVGGRVHDVLLAAIGAVLSLGEGEVIVDVESQLIDIQKPSIGGANKEFILSGRLDNLWYLQFEF